MSGVKWLQDFRDRLIAEGIIVDEIPAPGFEPAALITVDNEDWGRIGQQARQWGCRWVAEWAEDTGESLLVNACFEKKGGYLVARTRVQRATPLLASHTPYYPAADRPERHMQDMYGLALSDHPDTRRWTRHRAWGDHEYPLRRDFPRAGQPPDVSPPHDAYQFLFAHGSGVYEIPVGPVHAGIIEPGHFRFQAVGETVLNLEERLGYVHKGIEKIAEGRDAAGLARLAGRVSGDSTVAHAWAACMAMERAADCAIPPRVLALRAIMAERERVANHVWDIAAICNDVAFTFAYYQLGRIREDWLRVNQRCFGHRLLMDRIIPGGVDADLDASTVTLQQQEIAALRPELEHLFKLLDETPTLEDRLATTGVLSMETAAALGALGYVGRASGQNFDVRRDAPYPPYDALTINVPVFREGDVEARLKVRAEETLVSLELIGKLLSDLPDGPVSADWKMPVPDAEGLGVVDGWRGEILAHVRFDKDGKVSRYYPRDPSIINWPALELLIRGNIVPDFPVCNKSVNGSYSGHDL